MSASIVSPAEYRTLLRSDFASFLERSFYELNPGTEFIPGQYIELMAATLDQVRTGTTKRLMLNLPPRTLKSHAASVAFPAWLLGHNPAHQIICASYAKDLADKHARDCRRLMESAFYRILFPKTLLSASKTSADDFETTAHGFRMATSVGGVLTGRGADVIILDDILKPEDALSETRRRSANDWYFSTLMGRLNSKEHGAIIGAMQRLHQQDITGEVTARELWEVLSLPAIALNDELYQYNRMFMEFTYERRPGEALHPERDTVETYLKIREAVGEYNFQSQYQQSPTSVEGGLVKRDWLHYYDPANMPKDFQWILQSWDTACKTGDQNDYSVCTTWKVIGGDFYLIDVYRKRLTYPELKRAAVELQKLYEPWTILIEEHASGISLLQDLNAEYLHGVEAYNPASGTDKFTRFAAQSIQFESGRVYLPNQAPWLDEYIHEITGFPGAKYDDQVDSTTQALEILRSKVGSVPSGRFGRGSYGYETC